MTGNRDLRSRFEALPSPELASILRRHNSNEWRPEVFDVIQAILASRGIFSWEALPEEPSIEPDVGEHDLVEPAEDDEPIATGLDLEEAEERDRLLRAAGVATQVFPVPSCGFSVYVPKDSSIRAEQLLREAGLLAEEAPPPITDTGGPCPACGATVGPAVGECPTCGLAV